MKKMLYVLLVLVLGSTLLFAGGAGEKEAKVVDPNAPQSH